MQENKNSEERDFLSILFSFRGRINRKEYFIYGIVIPLILIALGFFIQQTMVRSSSFLVPLAIAVIILLATSVKRARDRDESIIALIILLLIPYISLFVIVYLLFAPSKEPLNKSKKKSRTMLYILLGVLLLLIGGIVLSQIEDGKLNSARRTLTCVQMKLVASQLEEFKYENSSYPQTEEGIHALVPYYIRKLPQDSWRNDFLYLLMGEGYELISYGQDGVESDDDIHLSECK